VTAAAIIELVGGLRAALFLSLAVVLGASWGVQSWRLDNARDGLQAARQTADAAVALNATLRQTVGTLQDANAAWAAKNAADLAAGREAVAAVERERDALQTEVDKRRADRNRLYDTDQSAAAWGRTIVPAGVAAGLRK
jgi:hypothetical protein